MFGNANRRYNIRLWLYRWGFLPFSGVWLTLGVIAGVLATTIR